MDINKTLKARGITHQQIADALGIDRITVTQTINKNPTYKTLKKYADIVGCRVVDFFLDELNDDEIQQDGLHITCPKCGAEIKIKLE